MSCLFRENKQQWKSGFGNFTWFLLGTKKNKPDQTHLIPEDQFK